MEKKQGYSERDKDREIICQRWPELSLAEKGKYILWDSYCSCYHCDRYGSFSGQRYL